MTVKRRTPAPSWQRRNAGYWLSRLKRRQAAVQAIQKRFGVAAITMGDGRQIKEDM